MSRLRRCTGLICSVGIMLLCIEGRRRDIVVDGDGESAVLLVSMLFAEIEMMLLGSEEEAERPRLVAKVAGACGFLPCECS